jgi:hypothetical protein
VLSVFSTDGYHEAGGVLEYEVSPHLGLEGNGFVQFYDGELPGARFGADARWTSTTRFDATVLSAGYGRVDMAEAGYHVLRAALGHQLGADLRGTAQAFFYLYDEAIEGLSTSSAQSVNLDYRLTEQWDLLWTALTARSPYAAWDASTQIRVSYQWGTQGGSL